MGTNSKRHRDLVVLASGVATIADADKVASAIVALVGAEFLRPLCDTTDNFGATTGGSGSYDDKLIEILTNMQDTLVEREALARFGNHASVPFSTPIEAAESLFANVPAQDLARRAKVEFRESDANVNQVKRITVSARDLGCGMSPRGATHQILAFKSSKSETNWLQGAYGAGVKATFRNAQRIVLITRRAPELLDTNEADEIAITVMQWSLVGKTRCAQYLVTKPWSSPGDDAPLYSFPASDAPSFEPGTQLILVSYATENVYVGKDLRDERTFGSLVDTRLFVPTTPIAFYHFENRAAVTNLRGLKRRLDENPGTPPRPYDETIMPFNVDGKVYHLPIRFWVFSDPSDAGRRRNFVAKGNVVTFTSNGQVHHRWDQGDFGRFVPKLSKLKDRIFAVVETDELPIELRTTLFTADRSGLVRVTEAIELERQVAKHIEATEELVEINGKLIEEELRQTSGGNTLNAAKALGAAFKGIGFGATSKGGGGSAGPSGTSGSGRQRGSGNIPGSGSGPSTSTQAIELYKDPTTLEGPQSITIEAGDVRSFSVILNALDGFVPDRARFEIATDHPVVVGRRIVIGNLRRGRARLTLTVPDDVAAGTFNLTVGLGEWLKTAGGVGPRLTWTIKVRIVEEQALRQVAKSSGNGAGGGPTGGDVIPIVWNNAEPTRAGRIEVVTAKQISATQPEYAHLESLGDAEVAVVKLNQDFAEFKKYQAAGVRDLSTRGIEDRKERYSIAVGIGLLSLDRAQRSIEAERTKSGARSGTDDSELIAAAQRSIALAALHLMPAYDKLAKMAGVDPSSPIAKADAEGEGEAA